MEEIVFLDAATVGNLPELNSLKELGNLSLYDSSTYSETIERVKRCTILLTNKVLVDKRVIDAAASLKLICVTATGMNNIDLDYTREKGISLKNVQRYSTESVAQITFGSLLYLMNHIPYYDSYVKAGGYSKSTTFTHIARDIREIKGKVFGIIGLGTIGKQVAGIAEAFGAKILFFSTSGKNSHPVYQRVALAELLANSDVVSIHAPLNAQTKNLINHDRLKSMKSSAILLNAGRGGIVNESDLARALDEGTIAAAAIDVMEKEPRKNTNYTPYCLVKY
jgi:lactate dehydrogenase-like 2-hydroxyacid dehydrogenase